jgi:hypothetical protein
MTMMAEKLDQDGSAALAADSMDLATLECDLDDHQLPLLKFGENTTESNSRHLLWQFCGKFKIIATPYLDGRHYANKPDELWVMTKRLQRMHEKDYVHADIRCFNLVFQGPDSRPIDLDFGGKVDEERKYPGGYVSGLGDGIRLGEGGKPITKLDDCFAWQQVVFVFHVLSPPETDPDGDVAAERERTEELLYINREKELRYRTLIPGQEKEFLDDLLAFLHDIVEAGWSVRPAPKLRTELEKYGFAVNCAGGTEHPARPRVGSKPATGSPLKRVP